jgi:hypothetical protein
VGEASEVEDSLEKTHLPLLEKNYSSGEPHLAWMVSRLDRAVASSSPAAAMKIGDSPAPLLRVSPFFPLK